MKDLNGLLPDTKQLLEKIAGYEWLKDFTFVGGSAIAVYLGHRLSEDLDIFCSLDLNKALILETLQADKNINSFMIVNDSDNQLDLIVDKVKLTFSSQPLQKTILDDNKDFVGQLKIASLESLSVLKVLTLILRNKKRDYYDL